MAGLVSFLLAHIAYVIVMLGVIGDYDTLRLIAVALLAVYAAGMTRWLWPHLAEMRWPVAAYILVIFCMGAVAVGAPARVMFHCGKAPTAYLLFQDVIRTVKRTWSLYCSSHESGARGDRT